MSNVEFLGENQGITYRSPAPLGTRTTPGIVGFLMRKKIISTEKQGYIVLVATLVVCVLGTILILALSGPTTSDAPTQKEMDAIMKESLQKINQ